MQRHRGLVTHQADGVGWRLAEIHACRVSAARRPPAASSAAAVFHGILHNAAELQARLGLPASALAMTISSPGSTREHGTGFVAGLEGEFCLALIDKTRQRW